MILAGERPQTSIEISGLVRTSGLLGFAARRASDIRLRHGVADTVLTGRPR
jgi:hypothetical protein